MGEPFDFQSWTVEEGLRWDHSVSSTLGDNFDCLNEQAWIGAPDGSRSFGRDSTFGTLEGSWRWSKTFDSTPKVPSYLCIFRSFCFFTTVAQQKLVQRKVLNMFAYTGRLPVSSGLDGGESVMSTVDPSKIAVDKRQLGSQWASWNFSWVHSRRCFEWLPRFKRQKEVFDCLILDPPSFLMADLEEFRPRISRSYVLWPWIIWRTVVCLFLQSIPETLLGRNTNLTSSLQQSPNKCTVILCSNLTYPKHFLHNSGKRLIDICKDGLKGECLSTAIIAKHSGKHSTIFPISLCSFPRIIWWSSAIKTLVLSWLRSMTQSGKVMAILGY